jgi:hypothetical protein
VRDVWDHKTTGPRRDAIAVTVAPDGASFLRVSKTNRFPIPPIIVADKYRVVLRAEGASISTLSGAITVLNAGNDELPAWKVAPGLPAWLTVTVTRHGRSQTLTNTVSTAGFATGSYHAVVRADNVEPVSGKPMSALYYDVDVEVTGRGSRKTDGGKEEPQ